MWDGVGNGKHAPVAGVSQHGELDTEEWNNVATLDAILKPAGQAQKAYWLTGEAAFLAIHHRRIATIAQTTSTRPNGHAPCRNP